LFLSDVQIKKYRRLEKSVDLFSNRNMNIIYQLRKSTFIKRLHAKKFAAKSPLKMLSKDLRKSYEEICLVDFDRT